MMGAWRPKHVEKFCSNKICILLHHVGVLFNLRKELFHFLKERILTGYEGHDYNDYDYATYVFAYYDV